MVGSWSYLMYVWPSVHDYRRVLKAYFQKELVPSTHVASSETNAVVNAHAVVPTITNPHTTVSEVHEDVTDPPTIVSDVHRGVTDHHSAVTDADHNPVKSEERGDGNDQSVSDTHVLYHIV